MLMRYIQAGLQRHTRRCGSDFANCTSTRESPAPGYDAGFKSFATVGQSSDTVG